MTRWGIAGTGGVATAFAQALREAGATQIVAVASRDASKARRFIDRECVFQARAHGSYEALMGDSKVEIVYVATPTSHHYRHTMMALNAGKHVLVEKPFTVNAAQAHAIAHLAFTAGLFCMEAMWPRFLPAYLELQRLLADHVVGEEWMLEASLGGAAVYDAKQRPFRLDLAGGSLMDCGVYPIQLASMVFGTPDDVKAVGASCVSGVDARNVAVFGYHGGQTAVVSSSIRTTLDSTAVIYGTDGMILLPGAHVNPAYLDVHWPGREPLHVDCIPPLHRLAYQAIEVQRCLTEGLTESPSMTLGESCAIMGTMDRVREQIGLRFPDDVEAL